MWKKIGLSLALLSSFLVGCNDDKPKGIDTTNNPEKVAVAFFNALYNEKDVKKAAAVCTPKLRRIILHYKSTSAVGRHVFNMSFDEVIVKPDDSGVKVREQFKEKAVITLYFNGTYNGEIQKDVKRISVIQKDDSWYIDKLLKDPF